MRGKARGQDRNQDSVVGTQARDVAAVLAAHLRQPAGRLSLGTAGVRIDGTVSRHIERNLGLGIDRTVRLRIGGTVRLRTLVDQGILKMAPASDGSAYQEYVPTPKGRGVFPILVALRQWSEEFDERPEEIATILVDRENGRPVRKLELHSQDGRLLTSTDTALKPRPAKRRRSIPA